MDFHDSLIAIYQRLFHVYAHLYGAHFRQLEARSHDEILDLNSSYTYFIVFALWYTAPPTSWVTSGQC